MEITMMDICQPANHLHMITVLLITQLVVIFTASSIVYAQQNSVLSSDKNSQHTQCTVKIFRPL